MKHSISTLEKIDIPNYVEQLKLLISSNINLPKEALNAYKSTWDSDFIRKNFKSHIFLVSKNNEKITGLLLGTPPEGGVDTIIWVLVDTHHQKQGLGTNLMEASYKVYKQKGAHKVKLTVPEKKTVPFYLKQGMVLEGEHRNHWWKSDFWSMGKFL